MLIIKRYPFENHVEGEPDSLMLLKSTDRSELELMVVGYQFPNPSNKNDDWLVIYIRMKIGSESWETKDPALLWQETHDLSKWLEGVARDDPRSGWNIGFLEPTLLFETHRRTKDSVALQVYCQKFPKPAPGEHFSRIFQVSRDQLKKGADELGLELQRFPSRFPIDESDDDDDNEDD